MDFIRHYDSPLGGITLASDGEALVGTVSTWGNEINADDEPEFATYIYEVEGAKDAEINMDGATEIGNETVKFFNGKFYSVFSRNYRAGILQDAIGIIHYCIFSDGDTEIYNVREHEVGCDEFFSTLKQRGAFTGNAQFTFDIQRFAAGHKIGCDNPDYLIDKLTAEYAEAEKISKQRQTEFDTAKKAVADAKNQADGKYFALTDIANKRADKLRKKILADSRRCERHDD